jgi:hypothetical protein
MAKKAKKQLYTVSAFTKAGAVTLAKTYRDKIGAKIQGDVSQDEKTSLWQFVVELPFE